MCFSAFRWGWEQLWNVPTTGMVVQNGYMFCGQVRRLLFEF